MAFLNESPNLVHRQGCFYG